MNGGLREDYNFVEGEVLVRAGRVGAECDEDGWGYGS